MSEYKLIVYFNGGQGGDGYKSPNKKTTEENVENGSVLNTIGTDISNSVFGFLEKGFNAYAGIGSVTVLAEVGKDIFSNYTQRIERFTGSKQAQDVASAIQSIAGKFLRPITAQVNYLFEREQSSYEKMWESIGLQLARERGGMSINRSRSEV